MNISKNKIVSLLFISSLNLCPNLFAQKTSTVDSLKKGRLLYDAGNRPAALVTYLNTIKINPYRAEIYYMAGKCYEEGVKKELSLSYYQKAYELDPQIMPDILYRLSKSLQLNSKFDDAIAYFKKYKAEMTEAKAKLMKSSIRDEFIKTEKRIIECRNAKVYYNHEFIHNIQNVKNIVNSEYADYSPLITSDNNTLIFTSKRGNGVSSLKDASDEYFEEIWYSNKVNGVWSTPKNIGRPLNTESHDACIALSPNGRTLYMYNVINGGDIYISNMQADGTWSKPEALDNKINSKFKEPSLSVTANGKTIYFSSNRPGGYGGLDIYVCHKQKDDNWSIPANLGSVVNSEYDEDGPFIDSDNRTLYFSSTGHTSMGGYDIYRTMYDTKRKSWGHPENMGYPINSPADDIYFVIAGDRKTAYFASVKEDSYGDKDIYQIDLDTNFTLKKTLSKANLDDAAAVSLPKSKGQINNALAKEPENITFKGIITEESKKPVADAIIEVTTVKSDQKPKEYRTKTDGSFEIPLAKGFDYAIDVEKDGFLFSSYNIDVKNTDKKQIYMENIELKKPEAGTKIVLKNVFFRPGSPWLKPESRSELDILFNEMNRYSNIVIEISGHTDNRGSAQVNKDLSELRAKAVFDYLVKKGISTSRLTYVGYGAQRPIAPNKTEEGRQSNRRTEFEIIKLTTK